MSPQNFLIDLTTSRQYKGHNPVGIVRTEREIGKALITAGCNVQFFYYDTTSAKLLTILDDEAARILGLSDSRLETTLPEIPGAKKTGKICADQASDDDLRSFLKLVELAIEKRQNTSVTHAVQPSYPDEPLEIFDGDILISAGLLWDGNFLESIYRLKQFIRFSFIQIVYDIVPVLIPEFCVPGMNIRFPKYILDVAWTADAIYCISDSTLRDLERYLQEHGLPIPAIKRIQLGADLAQDNRAESVLRHSLTPGKFVTYVSTIEPRKNHITLFQVWRQLFESSRETLVPLVIVGRQGWNSGDLLTMMQAAEHLYPSYIRILTEVSDADLDWLYKNSSFTVYPSFYEGWGLPVAESLARGKFCIASSTSSIPEVAQGFAELINPFDLPEWTRRIDHYLQNPSEVYIREQSLMDGYKIASWASAMEEFIKSVRKVIERYDLNKVVKA